VCAKATLVGDIFDVLTLGVLTAEERRAHREDARAVLEAAEDHEGLGLYWWSVAGERWNRCRAEDAVAACEQGLFHTAQTQSPGRTEDLTWWICAACVFGPTPVEEGIERLESLRETMGDDILLQAGAANALARLLAMRGEVERGREMHLRARETFREAGLRTTAAGMSLGGYWIEERAGDFAAAEQVLLEGLEELERLNDRGFRSTVAASAAVHAYLRGDLDETRRLCELVRHMSAPDDLINFVYLHSLEACLLAADGTLVEAEQEARRALELADTTDFFFARMRARLFLAVVLARAGKDGESAQHAADGLAVLEAKGDTTGRILALEVLEQGGVTL
jgi:hypothetical protein